MGRAKLRMELITKEKTRNTTYQKRKQGIIKKANEFTILCDVDTIIIIYPPDSNTPEIWPENPSQIKKTISSYKAKKGETGKKTYDLNDFFLDRKKKSEDELVKARKRNMEAKYPTWFEELARLTEGQLRHFAMGLENKENVVRALLEFKTRNMNINQLPFMFEPMVHYAIDSGSGLGPGFGSGLDHVQVMNHELGWFNDAQMNMMNSFIPFEHEPMGFGYPVFEGGMVYDNFNQWAAFPAVPPVVHGGLLPESQVNNGVGVGVGVGDFVMERFIG